MNNISSVGYRNLASFKNNTALQAPKKSFADKIEANNDKVLNYSPAVIGLMNAVCWTTLGMAFDKICTKVLKMGSNTKVSLAINGLIGAVMGVSSYCQAKKLQKNAKTEATS